MSGIYSKYSIDFLSERRKRLQRINFNEIQTIQEAKLFLSNFLNDYNLTLEDLPTFDFLNLENDFVYGCPGRNFDCDDTNLARVIFYMVWNDLPEMDLIEIGTGKKYRGDTLNTFNTVFSKDLSRAELLSDNNIQFLNEAESFRSKCYSLGNFSVLPNKSIPFFNNKSTTINLYRGNWFGWKDFYDKFLYELNLCLCNSNDANAVLDELVNENSFYFNFYNTIEKFINVNFLNFYAEENTYQIKELFDVNFHLWKKNSDKYINFARNYMDISGTIIDERSIKIYKKLKELF